MTGRSQIAIATLAGVAAGYALGSNLAGPQIRTAFTGVPTVFAVLLGGAAALSTWLWRIRHRHALAVLLMTACALALAAMGFLMLAVRSSLD